MHATVYVRDAGRVRRGPLRVLGGEAVLRANDVGNWWLAVDAADPKAARCVPGGGVLVVDRDTAEPLFSGPFTKIERTASADGPSRVVRLTGVTDAIHLFDRETLPDPTRADTAQNLSVDSHYTATGVAETVARALVNSQAGPGAITARRVPGLVLQAVDGLNGATVNISARYTPHVGPLLQELAEVGGVAWWVIQVGANLQFQVWSPRDLSRRARFSRGLHNLGGFSSVDEAPKATAVSVLAQGDLTARVVRHRDTTDPDALKWGRRIEAVLDRRDSDDNPTLDQAGDAHLAENGAAQAVSFEPLDLPSMVFPRAYGLSDLVTVETDWGTVTDRVRQVALTWESWGVQVKPLIGPMAAQDPNEPPNVRVEKNLRKRLGRLEGGK